MLRLSTAEQRFVLQGIADDVRTDGRARLDYRPVAIECGVLPIAHGSARVALVNGNTEILACVKVELGVPLPHTPTHGQLLVDVDCWSSASHIIDKDAAQTLSTELSDILRTILVSSGCVDTSMLCIVPGKHCWNVCVDAVVLDSGGSLVDTLVLAANAALADTHIPKVRLYAGEKEGDVELVLDDDSADWTSFPCESVPLAVTFWHVAGHTLVDARLEEETCADARTIVAVNRKGNICSVTSFGADSVLPSTLQACAAAAQNLAKGFFGHIDAAIDAARIAEEDEADGRRAGREKRVGVLSLLTRDALGDVGIASPIPVRDVGAASSGAAVAAAAV